MQLTTLDIVNGIFSIIYILISVIIGLSIASKYLKYKQRIYLLIGLTWIGMASVWTPSAISISTYILLGFVPPLQLLLFIAIFFLPFTQVFWLTVICVLKEIKRRKLIVGLFIIEGIIFDTYFLLNLFSNPSAIGAFSGAFDMNYKLWVNLFLFSLLIVFVVTGTILARESVKSNDKEINLKGKLLFLAFYSFVIGAILDIISATSIVLLTLARLILIFSAFTFYGGFILPNWMKKRFLK
jgi:hypothetical protein